MSQQACMQWPDNINDLLHEYSQEDSPSDDDYFLDEAYRIWSEEQNQDMPEDYSPPS